MKTTEEIIKFIEEEISKLNELISHNKSLATDAFHLNGLHCELSAFKRAENFIKEEK